MNTQKIKYNKNIRTFLVFLLLSFVFWLLIKLSRPNTTSITVNLNYTDLPKNKLFQQKPNKEVKVTLNGIGFTLFRSKISANNVNVSLQNIKKKKGTLYYYLSKNIIDELSVKFNKSNIVDVAPDTLFFDLGKSVTKKVAIIPNLDINYKAGYNAVSGIKLVPETITISGPESILDTIQNIQTKSLQLNEVNNNINKTIGLSVDLKNEKLSFSDTKVTITAKVDKYTERKIKMPYTIINKPENYKIKTFNDNVEVVATVSLSNFEDVSANDFSVVCDFKETLKNDLTYMIPRVKNNSKIVRSVKVIPEKIEFLIVK